MDQYQMWIIKHIYGHQNALRTYEHRIMAV